MNCLRCKQEVIGDEHKYGLHPLCFSIWFKVGANEEFVSLTLRNSVSNDPENKNNRTLENTSFYHGKFKKYSADLATDNYIIKMREEKEAPELPEVEYVCNQIADYVGLPVPEYYYIDFYGQKVFVTKVFIKKNSGSVNLEHIYKFRPDDKHNCESLADVIKKTTNRPYDVEVFFNTILFDAFIGNHDRHGRNLAFLVTPSGIFEFRINKFFSSAGFASTRHDCLCGFFAKTLHSRRVWQQLTLKLLIFCFYSPDLRNPWCLF